jgi:hypothetical protein
MKLPLNDKVFANVVLAPEEQIKACHSPSRIKSERKK